MSAKSELIGAGTAAGDGLSHFCAVHDAGTEFDACVGDRGCVAYCGKRLEGWVTDGDEASDGSLTPNDCVICVEMWRATGDV